MKQRFKINQFVNVLTEHGYEKGKIVNVYKGRNQLVDYRIKLESKEIISKSEFYISRRKKTEQKKLLYFLNIIGTNIYKIGITQSINSRIKNIQTSLNSFTIKMNEDQQIVELIATSSIQEWAISLEFFLKRKYNRFNIKDPVFIERLGTEWFKFSERDAIDIATLMEDKTEIVKIMNEIANMRAARTLIAMKFDILHFIIFGDKKCNCHEKVYNYRKLYIDTLAFRKWISRYLSQIRKIEMPDNAVWRLNELIKETGDKDEFYESYNNKFSSAEEIKQYYIERIENVSQQKILKRS